MSELEILEKYQFLELFKKPTPKLELYETLSEFKRQVEEILGEAKLLIPTTVLDSLVKSYRDSLKTVLEVRAKESLAVLEQLNIKQAEIVAVLRKIDDYLGKLIVNADLENEVLTKLKKKL